MSELEKDTTIERALDRLAQTDRAEPDVGFEDRIWHAMQQPEQDRIPGRRRKQKSTAWIPFVTAACIGIMGYIVWMPMINLDTSNTEEVASAEPAVDSTDLLLSSFDTMDMLIADGSDMDESLDMIELQIVTNEFELSSDSTWQELGGSL